MQRITATAIALVLAATPVLAQDTASSSDMMDGETDWAQLIRTRDMTGGPIYTTNEAHDEGSWGGDGDSNWGWSDHDEVGDDWNQVGTIEDVVLDRSGMMVGVVAEIGGFLDMGDKHVMLRVGDVDLVPVDDQTYTMITRYSEEELEEMPAVDEGWWN